MFKELLKDEELKNVKKSFSLIGSQGIPNEYIMTPKKEKLLKKDIKKRKSITAYRTFSISEKEWSKMLENGYAEIGNINFERGFNSFTINKNMLKRFYGGGDITIVIEVELNKYSPILNDSQYPEEKEILTYDLKWKVTDIDDSQRNWWILGKQIS
jgi:hypothetical protein